MSVIRQIIGLLPKILTDSLKTAFAILGGIEIVVSFTSFSIGSVGALPAQIGIVVGAYIVLVIVIMYVKSRLSKTAIIIRIGRTTVEVKEGDIFSCAGWRLIPFNEYYDTQVDDIVIDKESLNGKLINRLDDAGKDALKEAIVADDSSSHVKSFEEATGKFKYPLGRIKLFKNGCEEYMLLALTHFSPENRAFTDRGEYEQTLRVMWSEIDRTYASKPVFLPLIGSGKARLNMENQEIIRCMLCTLRTSDVDFIKPITIVLKKEVLEEINLYELKGVQ